MSTHLIEGQIFKLTTCKTCGARHLLPNDMFEGLREIGGYYHCPNGHGWGWRTGTERAAEEERQRQLDAARRERDLARQRIAQVEDEKREAIAEAEARTKAAEAATKRVAKRDHAGLCQCCNRTFSNVAQHMADMHPEIAVLKIPKTKKPKKVSHA